MGTEIERKFLVTGEGWRVGAMAVSCRQGYLAVGPPVAVRVRIMGGEATLNVKRATLDVVRSEFEYRIPLKDAEDMLNGLCEGYVIEKVRHRVAFGGKTWEVDVFGGANAGLVVAEIELDRADERFERPPWLGPEVSGDARYLNTSLSRRPYRLWPENK